MAERASITEKAVNTLRFKAGGEVRKDEQEVSTSSKTLRDLYFDEIKNYNIDKKTAGKYFRTATTDPAALTHSFDLEVREQLANAFARAKQTEALRKEHEVSRQGIMSRRKALRDRGPTPGMGAYMTDTPARRMMDGIAGAFTELRKQQKPISIDKIKIDVT